MDVRDVRHIFDPAGALHQKGGGDDGHSGIFCAADGDLAVEQMAALDVICWHGMILSGDLYSMGYQKSRSLLYHAGQEL